MRRRDAFVGAALAVPSIGYKAWRYAVLPLPVDFANALTVEGVRSGFGYGTAGRSLERFLRGSGPVFTKLGQILATRTDLLPKEICERLEGLYSQQPAMPKRELKAVLRRHFGGSLPFEAFEEECLGVGSIGQVHRARLNGGERVIVKILRPGITEAVDRDLREIESLLEVGMLLAPNVEPGMRFILQKSFSDLAEGLRREANFLNELEALERFRERLHDNPRLYVPKSYREHSSREILVMEELKGEPLSKFRERAKAEPEAAKRMADLALKEILRQIFDDGHFHADPHGGNLFLLEDGRLGLIDLGLTGELSGENRKAIARAVKALVSRDAPALIDALLEFGEVPEDFDQKAFEKQIYEVVARHKDSVVAHVTGKRGGENQGLDAFITDLFSTAHAHRIHVPSSASVLIKTLVTIEGVARGLDPELNLVTKALPVLVESLTPKWIRKILGR